MYILPLLIHGNPRSLTESHPVRLKPGFWRAISNNIVDTLLVVTDGTLEFKLEEVFEIKEPQAVWLVVKSAGTERSLTVMAEVYNGLANIADRT